MCLSWGDITRPSKVVRSAGHPTRFEDLPAVETRFGRRGGNNFTKAKAKTPLDSPWIVFLRCNLNNLFLSAMDARTTTGLLILTDVLSWVSLVCNLFLLVAYSCDLGNRKFPSRVFLYSIGSCLLTNIGVVINSLGKRMFSICLVDMRSNVSVKLNLLDISYIIVLPPNAY